MKVFHFGIMGAGNIANHFCHAVSLLPDCSVVSVSSKDMEKAKAFSIKNNYAAKDQAMTAYDSYEKMLQKEHLDCIYIATVPNSHYELAKLCISYGIPVLCEKAFFLNGKEAEEIFALAQEKQVFVMEAMWSRFLPANQKALTWIHEGQIGKITEMEIKIGWQPGENSRQFSRELGGGAMSDLTIYSYALADFFAEKQEISAEVFAFFKNDVDIIDQIFLRYDDFCATLSGSIVSAYQEAAILYGTEGKIVVPQPHMAKKAILYPGTDGPITWEDTETVNGFVYEIQEVMSCIRTGKTESTVVPQSLTLREAHIADRVQACSKVHCSPTSL